MSFFFLSLCFPPLPRPRVHFWFKLFLPSFPSDPQLFRERNKESKNKKSSVLLLRRSCLCRHSFCQTLKLYFYHFWFMRCNVHLFRLSFQESRVLLQSERLERDCGDVTPDIKSSTPPPPCLIDKDFWFQSSSFQPSPLFFTSFPPSLLFHSVYFWHRKTRREGERERL